MMKTLINERMLDISNTSADMLDGDALESLTEDSMDMRMPEMDGLEASSAIRAMKRADAKTIPIIALTANAFNAGCFARNLQSSPIRCGRYLTRRGWLCYADIA